MEEVESESKFVWNFLLKILLTPITLILVLFGKKEFKELFEPFRLLFHFIFEAKTVIILIIANIGAYIWSMFLPDATFNSLMHYPSDLFSVRAYSLITSGFLHASLEHLLGNMLALFIFGRVVERKFGAAKTALIYFGALIISGIFSSLIDTFITGSNVPGLGASGAIMGLVAAAMLIDPFYITYDLIIPLPIMIDGWIAIYADISGVINPTDDGIGHFAHIGGYLSVIILLFLLHKEERDKMKKGLIVNLVSLAILGIIYFLFLS